MSYTTDQSAYVTCMEEIHMSEILFDFLFNYLNTLSIHI